MIAARETPQQARHDHTRPTGQAYLVIGGNGFLGRAIVQQLLDRGEGRVSILDLRPAPRWDERIHAMHVGDITRGEEVLAAVQGQDVVLHTASPVHGLPASVYEAVNIHGTAQVIDACLHSGVRRLVYTGSASVVYDGSDLCGADERTPYCRVHMDAYNRSKAEGERLVLEANGRQGAGGGAPLYTCSLRPSGIFGPRDAQGSLAIAQAAHGGKAGVAIGDNANLFDMTYVDNAAHAHVLAADRLGPGNGTAGEAFNITNDQPMFFWDFPKKLYDGLGYRDTLRVTIPRPLGLVLGSVMDAVAWAAKPLVTLHPSFTAFRVKIITGNRYFDITKAKERLGYLPLVGMEEALERTAAWWRPQYGAREAAAAGVAAAASVAA